MIKDLQVKLLNKNFDFLKHKVSNYGFYKKKREADY